MYNDVLKLVSTTKTVDEYGDTVEGKTERVIFCEAKSIGYREFYQAQSVGMKPELTFKIADYYDYKDEQEVIYQNVVYKVLRTYRTTGNELEITVYGGVRNASA